MAKHVFKNAKVKIDGVDLTSSISAVTVSRTADELDSTGLGADARERISGLEDASVTISFFQDYGAGSVYATLADNFGDVVNVLISPTGATTATATAPFITVPVLVSQDTPVGGQIGDIATLDVTWPGAGAITVATTGSWAS